MLTVEKLAYIAGIVDGEGYVGLVKQTYGRGRRGYGYNLTVTVGMTNETLPTWLHAEFGGVLSHRTHGGNNKDSWDWRLRGPGAKSFLELILPYLVIKKGQAEIGISFQNIRDSSNHSKLKREVDELLYNSVRKLNSRGKKNADAAIVV